MAILPKSTHTEDSQVKQEPKSAMDDIKVKEEPVEEEQPQKMDLSSSNIKPDSPVSSSKSRDIKKAHRNYSSLSFTRTAFSLSLALVFTCDDCGIRYSNRGTLNAHREHYCTKRELSKSHLTGKQITIDLSRTLRKETKVIDCHKNQSIFYRFDTAW